MALQVYTLAEVAKILRIGIATAYALAEQGRLGGGKVGRGWRFTEADILQGIKPVPPKTSTRVYHPTPRAPIVIRAEFSEGAKRAIAAGLLGRRRKG